MRAIVTRPEPQARQWAQALRQHGIRAQVFPLIRIAPVADPAPLHTAWTHLDRYDAVMFVSGQAARFFFAASAHPSPAAQWPKRTRAWTPGTGTQKALLDLGLHASQIDVPQPRTAQFDSESLWTTVQSQVITHMQLLIVRGSDGNQPASAAGHGRHWLAEQAAVRGAHVDFLAAYTRTAPVFTAGQIAWAQAAAQDHSLWVFSSAQSIAHLRAALPAQDWQRARALTTHPRIAEAAHAAGFASVVNTRPQREDVIAAIVALGTSPAR